MQEDANPAAPGRGAEAAASATSVRDLVEFLCRALAAEPETVRVENGQLKMRLRVICNAIIDQSIHAGNMSEQEALDVMMKEGFQQEGEAVAKWKRARLSSAQLSTYFVGVTEHLALRA